MAQLTIKGSVFEVADDPSITPGAVLTEGMVASLQQTRRENIRNNMAKKVEDALNGATELSQEQHSALQAAIDEYAEKYEFGVRQAGAPRVVDPVEREARREAGEAIKQAYYAKHGERLKGEALATAVDNLMNLRGEDYRKRARATLRDRERAGEDLLAATGLAA